MNTDAGGGGGGHREYICMDADHINAFWLITDLCKIMQDGKHVAITQTIHKNLISWVCSVIQAIFDLNIIELILLIRYTQTTES